MQSLLNMQEPGRDRSPGTTRYSREGVRVLDAGKNLQRLYFFGPSSDMMTERDIAGKEQILRRFIFDQNGMLEETFSFGQRPRTFRYENGGCQIAVREGGQYGAVGKTYSFDRNGIVETAWGRDGDIERVYIFEAGNDTITERTGAVTARRAGRYYLKELMHRYSESLNPSCSSPCSRNGVKKMLLPHFRIVKRTTLMDPENLRLAAGLHSPAKDACHLIPVRREKKKGKIPVSMLFRMGIPRWMNPCRKSHARKRAVRFPMTNAVRGVNPDRIIRFPAG